METLAINDIIMLIPIAAAVITMLSTSHNMRKSRDAARVADVEWRTKVDSRLETIVKQGEGIADLSARVAAIEKHEAVTNHRLDDLEKKVL